MIKKESNHVYNFTGTIEKRSYQDEKRFGYVRVLLREVRLGKLLFRDHVWVRNDKFIKHLKDKTNISFKAKVKRYIDVDNTQSYKLGLVQVRNISVLKYNKKMIIDKNHFKGTK